MKDNLFENIPDLKKKSVLFVGVGNAIKSDDGIGIYICSRIQKRRNISTLIVESGIEKFVGKINNLAPQIIIFIDCTDFNEQPGYHELIPMEKIQDHTANTHTISLKRISEFFPMEKYLLGIQPEYVGFGEDFSSMVKQKADYIIKYINNY